MFPTKTPATNRKKSHAKYAGMLLASLGVIANITAVVGLVMSHINILVITAAVLALFCGLYFLLKAWGRPMGWYALGLIAILMASSAVLALSLQSYHQHPSGKDYRESVQPNDPDDSGGGSDGLDVEPNSTHELVFTKKFTLQVNQGLELDDETGTKRYQQTSAAAPNDVYFSESAYVQIGTEKLYPFMPVASTGNPDADEFTACDNLIKAKQDTIYVSSSIGSYGAEPGAQYCMATSKGRRVLLTLGELVDASDNTASVSSVEFTVKLWN